MSARHSQVFLRPDLLRYRIWTGSMPIWVLKDPVGGEFYFFSDAELDILEALDGKRSFREIYDACVRRSGAEFLSAEALLRFIADAARRGLLTTRGLSHEQSLAEQAGRPWWLNPLAIRFPGVNPDRFLTLLVKQFARFLHPLTLGLLLITVAIAALLAATQQSQLIDGFQRAGMRLSDGRLLDAAGGIPFVFVVAIAIAVAKVVHELAHGIVCKLFGGECRELGVMLLVGVPCLYCDVTDAWILPERWKRVLVSAAGMMAEILISAVAVIVWTFSLPGTVHDLALLLVLVCSVSTLIFNGNPLMRYDGYFIAADLVGVPNLGQRSAELLRSWIRRILWGESENESVRSVSLSTGRRTALLGTYAVASLIYRVAVVGLIGFLFARLAMGWGLGWLAALLIGSLVAAAVIRWGRPLFRRPKGTGSSPGRDLRPTAWLIGAALVIASLLLMPLPHRLKAASLIVPAGERSLRVTTPGRLVAIAQPGSLVQADEPVATLSSWKLALDLTRLRGEQARLETWLSVLVVERLAEPTAAVRIPEVTSRLAATRERLRVLEQEADKLVIRAPATGKVYRATERRLSPADRRLERFTWYGLPTDSNNLGAYVAKDTTLCRVGDPNARVARLLIREGDLEWIRRGQRVSISLPGYQDDLQATVLRVSASPVREIADEPAMQEMVRLQRDADGVARPVETVYEVLAAIESGQHVAPSRMCGAGKIHVGSISLLKRLSRFIAENFSFQS